jgi:hypothetical protein
MFSAAILFILYINGCFHKYTYVPSQEYLKYGLEHALTGAFLLTPFGVQKNLFFNIL